MTTSICRVHSQIIVSVTNIDSVTCFGLCNGSITVSASGGTPPYNYQWSNSQTTPTDSDLCTGTYAVTVTDAIGSTETDTFTIYDPPYPALHVHADSVNELCFGECSGHAASVVTGGVLPYSYEWFDENGPMSFTGTELTNLCTGYYCVMVTDSNGCVAADTTFVGPGLNIDASFTATPVTGYVPLTIHFTYTGPTLTGNYFYWSFGDGGYSQVKNPTHIYTIADTFTVWLDVYNGNCEEYINMMVYTEKPSSLPDVVEETSDLISIFPNPVTDILNIETTVPIYGIEIYDISGRLMCRTSSKAIDCSNFVWGIYLLKIETGKGLYYKKIIIFQ